MIFYSKSISIFYKSSVWVKLPTQLLLVGLLSLHFGSKSHKVTVVIWLLYSLVLFFLLFTIRLEPANAQIVGAPNHFQEFNSVKYAETYWSVTQVRTTDSDVRDCRNFMVCDSVVVLEVVLTNAGRNKVSINTLDLGIAFSDQAYVTAARFDCPSIDHLEEFSVEFAIFFIDLASSSVASTVRFLSI